MWKQMNERLAAAARHMVNLLVACTILICIGIYFMVSSVITVAVINDLRLDTYLDVETGFGIVMLVYLLGWVPHWFRDSLLSSSRRH
jgi:uncharacterized membrane protein